MFLNQESNGINGAAHALNTLFNLWFDTIVTPVRSAKITGVKDIACFGIGIGIGWNVIPSFWWLTKPLQKWVGWNLAKVER